jgi:hypothetical protein
MANLSTKIKMYCDANGVCRSRFFRKMLCCKMIVMAKVLTLRSGI